MSTQADDNASHGRPGHRGRIGVLLMALLIGPAIGETPALAHGEAEWIMNNPAYLSALGQHCCGPKDCERIPASFIREEGREIHVLPTGQVFHRAWPVPIQAATAPGGGANPTCWASHGLRRGVCSSRSTGSRARPLKMDAFLEAPASSRHHRRKLCFRLCAKRRIMSRLEAGAPRRRLYQFGMRARARSGRMSRAAAACAPAVIASGARMTLWSHSAGMHPDAPCLFTLRSRHGVDISRSGRITGQRIHSCPSPAAAPRIESKDRSVCAGKGRQCRSRTVQEYQMMSTSPARTSKPMFPSVEDDPRWARIVARDKTADGQLWYSVLTTGIYCRPSCPSRTANPRNVQIHDSLESARATGFRSCRRCNPDGPSIEARKAALVAKACRIVEDSEEEPSLEQLADAVGRSPSYFHRVFKATTGLTPKDYAAAQRAKKVRRGLAAGSSVTAAIYDAGFNSSGRFYEKATDMLGMTPSRYRVGGADEEIRFAVGQTSLGAILVASSRKGVASILLGNDPDELVRDLQDRFPKARLIGADRDYETLVARVVGLVEAPAIGQHLPLDVRGTAFQQRVWRALQEIPVGETVSYAEIARRIGSPNAAHAVAGACTANNLAVAIPCHRVIRKDGSLSGYAWGVERKRDLLDREAARKA